MSAPFLKHSLSILLSIFLIFALFVTAWTAPQAGMAFGFIFLLFCLIATSYTIVKKHRKPYLLGEISLFACIRNSCFEITAILLAMSIAGLIGRYISNLATGGISGDPAKIIVGIVISLSVGWTIGLLIKNGTGRLMKSLSGR